jgi:exopolyphosphatase/guanosine-5'-triphosphate,3'-diphosphate pyrophosphatase
MVRHQDAAPLNVAAVDLGSNSFHMVIGRQVDQELQIVDRVREHVSLASGLDDKKRLTPEAQDRALVCLEKMGQRLRGLPGNRVRVVGTNTLRRARGKRAFRAKAERALGYPIEIIAGAEEARLIYLGVAHSRFSADTQLVADIGGGSTEIIIGEGFEVLRAHSLFMGCVTFSRRFFPEGELRKEHFRNAEIAARLELESIQQEMRGLAWEIAVGASGTIHAVDDLLRENGWSDTGITAAGLKKLRREMIEAGRVSDLRLPGLKDERAPVLAGGLAILRAIFKSLEVERMEAASGALREGVLVDLLGRIRRDDTRDATIARMVERFRVDLGQAARVERTALRLLDQLGDDWSGSGRARRFLVWASRLHETGLAISHTGFHRHGAYLVTHSDMPGFSADDQATLAALIRTHRRKVHEELFLELPGDRVQATMRLCVVFRLAVLLNRGRVPQATPALEIAGDWRKLTLRFPRRWAEVHPLTAADLEREAGYLGALGIKLRVVEEPGPRLQAAREA